MGVPLRKHTAQLAGKERVPRLPPPRTVHCAVVKRDQRIAVVGVRLAAGVVWFASASDTGQFVDDRTDRLVLADDSLGEDRALAELLQSMEALFARLGGPKIALLNAGSSRKGIKLNPTLRRGALEGVVAVAAHRQAGGLVRVTHERVEKCVGVRPTDAMLREKLASRVLGDPPARWSDRAPAFAAAVTVMEDGA